MSDAADPGSARGGSAATAALRQAPGASDCSECGGDLVTADSGGEAVCEECGLVADTDRIDRGPEWRSFTTEQKRKRVRVGAPTTELRHDRGLSAEIGTENRDAHGKSLSADQRHRMNRLRKLNRRYRVRDSRDRNLRQALGEIDRMGCALGLPEGVREAAAVTYRRALEEDIVLGRSIEAVATASLYAAARQAGTPRSTEEIARVSRVEELPFVRAYRQMVRELGLEVDLADPASFLRRFASDLGISNRTERRAHELLRAGQDATLHVGKSPTSLAAGAIYAACLLTGDDATQREIADVADVSEVTIRNRYTELLSGTDVGDPPEP